MVAFRATRLLARMHAHHIIFSAMSMENKGAWQLVGAHKGLWHVLICDHVMKLVGVSALRSPGIGSSGHFNGMTR